MTRVFVGVGSNIGSEANIREALRLLAARTSIAGISTFYRTAPLNRPGQAPFLNGVVELETDLPPLELKQNVLRQIETRLGRVRTDDKYAPRTIDLDILVYDDLTISSTELTIPDAAIAERAFLAVPLCELAPELVVPGMELPICIVAGTMDTDTMEPLPLYTDSLRKDLEDEYGKSG